MDIVFVLLCVDGCTDDMCTFFSSGLSFGVVLVHRSIHILYAHGTVMSMRSMDWMRFVFL